MASCSFRQPHIPHSECVGLASEYPSEKTFSLQRGSRFDTPFESGCIVISDDPIGEYLAEGSFRALDSEGVECSFSPETVI